MTATLEHIKSEIRSLEPHQIEALLRDLNHEHVMPATEDDDAVAAAMDTELAERVKDVEEGRIELLTAEESDRQTDALFAKLGIQRPVFRP